jgi:GT2 family glycosyltransferase
MNEAPDVSIIIVTYNGRDFVRRCLTSVYEQTRDVGFELVAVDNASRDGTPEMIAAEFPQVRLERRSTNAGFASGVNEGIEHARGRYVLMLNPDAVLAQNILPPMLAYLAQHPDIGLLAPKLLDAAGTLQLSCRAFPTFSTALFNRYSLMTRLFPGNRSSSRYLMTNFGHDSIADVDWVSGACWLLPRSTCESVGTLDEAYFWSIEDVDYCQRVHRAGLRVVYFPDVSVVHRIGGSASSAPARAIIARHRGMWRYYSSYLRPQNTAARVAVDLAVSGGIVLRCAAQLSASALRGRRTD